MIYAFKLKPNQDYHEKNVDYQPIYMLKEIASLEVTADRQHGTFHLMEKWIFKKQEKKMALEHLIILLPRCFLSNQIK